MTKKSFDRGFSEWDLYQISSKLKSKLLPVDKVGCQELLLELGKYDPDARKAELKKLYPIYKDWQDYEDKAILGDSSSTLPPNWKTLREKLKSLFYSEQGEHTLYEERSDGTKYPVLYVFDAYTGRTYRKDHPGWVLHHLNFNEYDNNPKNFLWAMARKDPDTGKTSHMTIFSTNDDSFDKRQYMAEGRMIKAAFRHGYAPRSWSFERQAYYYEVLRRQARRFLTN